MEKTIFKIYIVLQCIATYCLQLSGAIIVEKRSNQPALDSGAYTPLQSNYDHDPEAVGTVAFAPRFQVQSPVRVPVQAPVNTQVQQPVRTQVRAPVRSQVQTPVRTQVSAPVQAPANQGFFYPRGSISKSSNAGDSNVIVHVIDAQGNDFAENVNELLSTLNRMTSQNYPVNSFQVEKVPLYNFQGTKFPTQGVSANTVPNFNIDQFPSGGGQTYSWSSGYRRESWTGPDGITKYKTMYW